MSMRGSLIALLLGAVTSQAAFAVSFQPARIGNQETSLANLIGFPDIPGDYTLYVRCEVRVGPAGGIFEIGCYSDPDVDSRFYRAFSLSAESATLLPASVDGENVSSLVMVTVVFRSRGGERVKAVIPNHGTNAKELGLNYIAPQRYGNNRYEPRSEIGLVWADASIDVNGQVHALEFVETKWSNREAKRYGTEYMEGNRFMPGFVDGEPYAMRFVKPIFGFRNGFMWMDDDSKCRSSSINCEEYSRSGRSRYVFDD